MENDPALIRLIRPNKNKADLETRVMMILKALEQRLKHEHIYLIYLQDQLIDEMGHQLAPKYL